MNQYKCPTCDDDDIASVRYIQVVREVWTFTSVDEGGTPELDDQQSVDVSPDLNSAFPPIFVCSCCGQQEWTPEEFVREFGKRE